MAGGIVVSPVFQFCGADGLPISGGLVYTYLAGTTTETETWQDEALSDENTNPIELDVNGRCIIWGESLTSYKLVVHDADDVLVVGAGADNVTCFAMETLVTDTQLSTELEEYARLDGAAFTGAVTFAGAATFNDPVTVNDTATFVGAVTLPTATTIGGVNPQASRTQSFHTPGTFSYVAKATTTYITGSGGGSGGASSGGGAGGGADAIIKYGVTTVVGTTYTVTVGAGGAINGAGGTTSFGSLLVLAGGQAPSGATDGGEGGPGGSPGDSGTGGGSMFGAPATQAMTGRLYGGGGTPNKAGAQGFLIAEW